MPRAYNPKIVEFIYGTLVRAFIRTYIRVIGCRKWMLMEEFRV